MERTLIIFKPDAVMRGLVGEVLSRFEKAGFKNAIIAKMAPTAAQDSTWSLDDASHSAIIYKPSETENASGPHISDPRSGEILETHINWYDSMSITKRCLTH